MTDANPFVGTWKLIAWEVTLPDGTLQYPYGQDAVGYLIHTADGYMSAQLMDTDRQQSDPHVPLEPAAAQSLSEPDRARAYSTYLAYCGTYRVEGNTLIHHVIAGLIPSWTDTDQRRPFQFVQDRLIIQLGNQKLTWERAVKQG